MATFVFENMTQAQADALTGGDILAIATTTSNANNIGVVISSSTDTVQVTTLTVGTKSLVFSSVTLQSLVNQGNLVFNDNSRLFLGVNGGDNLTGTSTADRLEGFAGADQINGGEGPDIIAGGTGTDTLIGGTGVDSLSGGSGSDRFSFSAGHAAPLSGVIDVILDYEDGIDTIRLPGRASARPAQT